MKALGDSAAFERTKSTEHMTQKKKNPKMTNENRISAANGENETNRNTTTNENAENDTANMSRAVNEKAERNVTETKNETTNENAGKPVIHTHPEGNAWPP